MDEPVLQYDDLQTGQQFPAVPCLLEAAFVDSYLQATGEQHPLFAITTPGTTSGNYAPPLCTSLVRFAKGSLGGRWPTGTVHLSQEMRFLRPLHRGEGLTLEVQIGGKYSRTDRRYVELLTTTRDREQRPVVHGTMLMLWAGATQPSTQVQKARTPHERLEPIPDGKQLVPITAKFTRSRLQAYGEVAGARDPIHLDPQVALRTRFGKNIAQGLLILTLISRLILRTFAEDWLTRGALKVRFVKPVFVGDQVTACGVLLDDPPGGCVVWCENQHGDRVIDGQASV
jgi:acyl dehydratase